jgi:dCMP deaminase
MDLEKAKKYFGLVKHMADTFSKDPNTKVGCLLLAPDSYQILSLGYNGFPRGVNEKDPQRWERPEKYYFVEHSERNCLYNACRSGVNTNGSIAVITLYPCSDCCRALIQSGIKTVITVEPDFTNERWGEDFKRSELMFGEAGVQVFILRDELLQM